MTGNREKKDSLLLVHSRDIDIREPFTSFAARFARMSGTVVLMSGGNLDCARYHILGAMPWMSVKSRNREIEIERNNAVESLTGDPFETLRNILSEFRFHSAGLPEPISAGLLGYFAYDLKNHIEKLPRTAYDDSGLPQMCLFAPSVIVIRDRVEKKATACFCAPASGAGKGVLDELEEKLLCIMAGKVPEPVPYYGGSEQLKSNFTKTAYMEAVDKIKEYIVSGDAYQVNMSRRFETDFKGCPFTLFSDLYNANPAPFFAFINAGDHHIVSTSPERFLKQSGRNIETRPIKGTRPRGATEEEDLKLKNELAGSGKDDAELSMIVDLLRNDIGKVCRAGSVRVSHHKSIEAYRNVYHLVSVVEGELADERDSVDVLTGAFPGGSITGCPKIRSMEIIDELEPCARHIYTGSIGYVSFHDTMDLSIAIRTAVIFNDRIRFSSGGGIVFDSNPEDEFEETSHKAGTLTGIFKGRSMGNEIRHAWVNGSMVEEENVLMPVLNTGFQYGYGFFETMRHSRGKVQHLEDHLQRFSNAWQSLFNTPFPDLSWDGIIAQVIGKNGFGSRPASVKLTAVYGNMADASPAPSLAISAKPYVHRLEALGKSGLDLAVYPQPRQTPLADHKTMNYLYYLKAGEWAKKRGADEAIILNPDGSVSETNTANLIAVKDGVAVLPESPHVLNGVMKKNVCRLLKGRGYDIEQKTLSVEALREASVILTNSLMGAVPVLSIDGIPLKMSAEETCRKINEEMGIESLSAVPCI